MGERVAVDRSHVHPKGVRVRKSTVMVHGCEPNCPAVLLLICKLFSCVIVWLIVLMVQMHVASPILRLHGAVEGGALVVHHVIRPYVMDYFGPRSVSPVRR